ncbi:MAG: response regulator [Spirochaetaceae bacterium]|nr:MAG: response regulator [Spirochaetaceae bacterium]
MVINPSPSTTASPKQGPLHHVLYALLLGLLSLMSTFILSDIAQALMVAQFLTAGSLAVALFLVVSALRNTPAPAEPQTAEMEHSPEQLQLAIESMQVGVWDFDIVGNTLHWDRRMYELVGMDPGETEPSFELWRRCILPRDYLEPNKALGSFYQEFPIVYPDGQLKYLAGSALVIRNSEDIPVRIVGINYDITERRLSEEELEEALVRAERLAREAELAAETKGEFLANMSHEIRTPINGVIGLAGVLLDSELNDSQRMYAEIIRQSADTLLFLINDILDFSKLEAEKLQLEEVVFSPSQVIEDVGDALALVAGQKHLEFSAYTTKEVPAFVQGDPGRLRQVLLNLVGNAIKFTNEGSVELRLSIEREVSSRLLFEVIDSGIGIAPDKIQSLFDPFVQVDGSATRSHGGTGLGLSISRRLVTMMGGEITVESELGCGSRFSFSLPLVQHEEHASTGVAGPSNAQQKLSQAKVVVLSTVPSTRRALTALLDELGVACTTARSMEEIEAPASYDFLILDVVHGRSAEQSSDPPELVELLRTAFPDYNLSENPPWASGNAVALIPFGTAIDMANLRSVGLCGAISKPAKRRTLLDCLVAVQQGTGGVLPSDSGGRRVQGGEAGSQGTGHLTARILVVEDNVTNQKVARIILEKFGHRVDTVADGNEAVRALSMAPYDLVFMDVQMPIMDGLTATRLIRQGAHGVLSRTIPIVAMTAHALVGDKERCLEAGMDDYIAKPISPEQVMAVLERYLERSTEPPPAPAPPPAPRDEIAPVETVVEAVPANNENPVFDRTSFLARVVNDETLAAEVAGIFIETTPEHIAHLRRSIEADESHSEVRECAHRIKGSAGNISAFRLYQIALELEHAASENRIADCLQMIPELEHAFVELRGALRSEFHLQD